MTHGDDQEDKVKLRVASASLPLCQFYRLLQHRRHVRRSSEGQGWHDTVVDVCHPLYVISEQHPELRHGV